MRQSVILLAAAALAGACVDAKYTCSTNADCPAGTTCDSSGKCAIPGGCEQICAANQACDSATKKCVAVAPGVGTVTAPQTWSNRSQTVTVTAVIDGTGTPGVASATLQIAGQTDIGGTTTDTGVMRTYSFAVPGSVQAAGSETPVNFTVFGTDTGGHSTPAAGFGHGQLLIDDNGPTVSGVTINPNGIGVGVSGIMWFKAAATGNIDAQVGISDAGSGVDPASLTLVIDGGTTRLDTGGTPTCGAGASAQALVCHFAIPLSTVATGSQRLFHFHVAGTDKAANAVKTNTAAVGIDGKAPAITFTIGNAGTTGSTTTYPANFADCTGGVADAAVYCGHDGAHFYRAGDGKYSLTFTVSDVFAAPDEQGSGADTTSGGCSIAGSTATCTVTYDTGTSTFKFPANFVGATFTSGATGTGTVSATVTAKDAVGNQATSAPLTINVTRLKWMRSMAGQVTTFKGSPVVTAIPAPQIIFAGTDANAGGPIVSLGPDGAVRWRTGAGNGNVSNNVAYSSATNTLYVLPDASPKLFAYTVAANSGTASYNCALKITTTNGQAVGSPAILSSGGVEYALVSDSTLNRLWAFTGSTGACGLPVAFNNSNAWTSIANPPVTDGAVIYLPHDTTKLSKVAFSAGTFGTVTDAPGAFTIAIFANVAVAGSLFFGDVNTPAHLFSYSTDLQTANWAAGAGAMTGPLRASSVVSGAYAFGVPTSADGHLRAFNKADGTLAWGWPTPVATVKTGDLSAPSIGADNTIYFSEGATATPTPPDLVALTVTSGTPALASNWSSSFQGDSGVTPSTALDSVGTEPVIDASGVLYFGTLGGNIYALITDSGGPQAPTAGTWPRVGYDNCNSSNTSFSCQ